MLPLFFLLRYYDKQFKQVMKYFLSKLLLVRLLKIWLKVIQRLFIMHFCSSSSSKCGNRLKVMLLLGDALREFFPKVNTFSWFLQEEKVGTITVICLFICKIKINLIIYSMNQLDYCLFLYYVIFLFLHLC